MTRKTKYWKPLWSDHHVRSQALLGPIAFGPRASLGRILVPRSNPKGCATQEVAADSAVRSYNRGVGSDVFRFGDLTVDAATGLVHRNGVRIALQPQPARLLLLLVRRAGHVVARDEIRAHIWGDTVVEFDQNINYCVRQIRTALGDDDATLVQTVPRQGYRFTMTPESCPAPARPRLPSRPGVVASASLALAFAAGFLCGAVAHQQPELRWSFVYRHLTGEANCPYMRFLSPLHRSS